MDIISLITGLASTVVSRVWPDKTLAEQQKFTLELQAALMQSDLLKSQVEVNKAEASNPNRKWTTWRELLGYVLVCALTWQWVAVPFISYVALLFNHPIDTKILPDIQILDMLYIILGMLGLDSGAIIANRMKRK